MSTAIETKQVGGRVVEVKQEDRNGVPVGIVKGYIATWDIDRGDWSGLKDQFVRGAFLTSLAEHREKRRQIRLKDHHGRTVGGFPIDTVIEDDIGLLGVGEINMEVQQGREAFSLAKQGVLTDFSIGFSVVDQAIDNNLRTITEAIIWEGSIVDEPMNPHAKITEVKTITPFQDFKTADSSRPWDLEEAQKRVREFTGSDEEPSSTYRKAFVYYDTEKEDSFDAYKLQIADVVEGRLVAVPLAIHAAAEKLINKDPTVPDTEREAAMEHLEKYFEKMGLPTPFDAEKQHYVSDDVKNWTPRQFEKALRSPCSFSKSAAKIIASRLEKPAGLDPEQDPPNTKGEFSELFDDLKSLTESVTTKQ